MKNNSCDILIIGAGAAGAAAAWNLSNSGFKILCMDQGPIIDPKTYSFNRLDWEELSLKKFNIDPNIRKLKSDYPINTKNSPISIANFNAIGGSTILYSGHFPRFHSSDFKTKSLDDIGYDWPFEYKDLKPFYEINDKIMGVAGLSGDPAYPDIKNLLPPVNIEESGEKIARAFNKLGWHWWPSYSGIATKSYDGRKKNSKSDVNQTYLPKAISNGVIIKPNCRVKKIKLDKMGRATGVIYNDPRNIEKFQPASLIIVACSGVGTPRLLLNSANKKFPNGLANSSGLVGKNLMLHPLGFVEGKFKENLESYKGPQGCCIFSQEFYKTTKNEKFNRGYTIQILRGAGPMETALSLYKFKKIKFGKTFHKNFLSTYGHTIPAAIICEDLPEEHNCIELDHKNKDTSNMPGVKINYKLSQNSKRMLSHGISKVRELMKVAGAKSIISFGPVRHTGWHLMGTAKMGNSKKKSVVNEFGQTHDIKNLVIADSSVFVTSGGVNPVSTLQAISLRITNEIKKSPQKYFELK